MHLSQCLTSHFRSKLSCLYTLVYTFPALGMDVTPFTEVLKPLWPSNRSTHIVGTSQSIGYSVMCVLIMVYLAEITNQFLNSTVRRACSLWFVWLYASDCSWFKQSGRICSKTNYIVNCHCLWASGTCLHSRCLVHASKSSIIKYSTHLWTIGTEWCVLQLERYGMFSWYTGFSWYRAIIDCH